MRIGLISDTHIPWEQKDLPPQVMEIFQGVDLILHAGDVGDPDVLTTLAEIAPVVAIRGNMDYGAWADDLPTSTRLEIGGVPILIIHDLLELDLDPTKEGIQVIICGHTHRSWMEKQKDVLLMNPGSAGYRNRLNRISIAKLFIREGRPKGELIELDPEK